MTTRARSIPPPSGNRRLPDLEIRNEADLKRALRLAYFGPKPVKSSTVWAVSLRYSRMTELRRPRYVLGYLVRYAVGRSQSIMVGVDDEIHHHVPEGYYRDLDIDILDPADVRRVLLERMPRITESTNPFKRLKGP